LIQLATLTLRFDRIAPGSGLSAANFVVLRVATNGVSGIRPNCAAGANLFFPFFGGGVS
jgi:hypothetical protein